MPGSSWSAPTRRHLPIILIRSFGGLDVEDEKALAYQGFNDGRVYPHKRGENYIYEDLILRLLKHRRRYYDATNVVGYFANAVTKCAADPGRSRRIRCQFLHRPQGGDRPRDGAAPLEVGGRSVLHRAGVPLLRFERSRLRGVRRGAGAPDPVHPGAAQGQRARGPRPPQDAAQGQHHRSFHGRADRARGDPAGFPEAHRPRRRRGSGDQQDSHPRDAAQRLIFQLIRDLRWLGIDAEEELEHFNPEKQKSPNNQASWVNLHKHFPLERLLTVAGTNYRTYGVRAVSWANRLFAIGGEYGPNYNRSDGLVKQDYAQIAGAPRTFVHKCHGGFDPLVTSRETYEIATRFFKWQCQSAAAPVDAKIKRGLDWIGKSEFFFGVSIKLRRVDFELFHQSKGRRELLRAVPHR